MGEPSLFDAAPYTVEAAPVVKLTDGERRRRRQAAQIAAGLHPLSLLGPPIRLHPDASRTATKENAAARPTRCGTCQWRAYVGGGNRAFPKCLLGAPLYDNGNVNTSRAPRASHGPATDVAAWWPGCVDWAPAERRIEGRECPLLADVRAGRARSHDDSSCGWCASSRRAGEDGDGDGRRG